MGVSRVFQTRKFSRERKKNTDENFNYFGINLCFANSKKIIILKFWLYSTDPNNLNIEKRKIKEILLFQHSFGYRRLWGGGGITISHGFESHTLIKHGRKCYNLLISSGPIVPNNLRGEGGDDEKSCVCRCTKHRL